MAKVEIKNEDDVIVIDVPSLRTVPALPADYPLFDWADWPNSRAALVAGGQTKLFEKACWNAIIDTFVEAVEAAGLPFYRADEGLTPDHLKLTKGKFGRLLATLMNTTVGALDDVVQLPWRWSFDQDHRGYLGRYQALPRKTFRGSSWTKKYPSYGFEPDIVYPEYILDLVQRLNMIIELMRDTYPYTQELSSHGHARSIIQPTMRAGRSVPIIRNLILSLAVSKTPLTVDPGIRISPTVLSKLSTSFTPELLHSASVEVRMPILTPFRASAEVKRASTFSLRSVTSHSYPNVLIETIFPADFSASVLGKSANKADVDVLESIATVSSALIRSILQVDVSQLPPVNTASRMLMHTMQQARCASVRGKSFVIVGHSVSKATVTATSGRMSNTKTVPLKLLSAIKAEGMSAPIRAGQAEVQSKTRQKGAATATPSLPIAATEESRTEIDISVTSPRSRPGWVKHQSVLSTDVSLEQEQVIPVEVAAESTSDASLKVEQLQAANVSSQVNSSTNQRCCLNMCAPPMWRTKNRLYVSMVRAATQAEGSNRLIIT